MLKRLVLLAVAVFSITTSPAALVITLQQSGNNVVATTSGSLDVSGLAFNYYVALSPALDPSAATIVMGLEEYEVGYFTGIDSAPSNFGTGGLTQPDSGEGIYFGIAPNAFYIQRFYEAGSPLYSSSTWNNATFASLGITQGTYTWSWSSDSITLAAFLSPLHWPSPDYHWSSLRFCGGDHSALPNSPKGETRGLRAARPEKGTFRPIFPILPDNRLSTHPDHPACSRTRSPRVGHPWSSQHHKFNP